MFNLASTNPIPDAHITTDVNLAYGIHKTRVPADKVDNPIYHNTHTHASRTPPPSPPSPQQSMDMSTNYASIVQSYESPVAVSTSTFDSRPPALLPSTASTDDATQRLSTGNTDPPPMPLPGGEKQRQHSESDKNYSSKDNV